MLIFPQINYKYTSIDPYWLLHVKPFGYSSIIRFLNLPMPDQRHLTTDTFKLNPSSTTTTTYLNQLHQSAQNNEFSPANFILCFTMNFLNLYLSMYKMKTLLILYKLEEVVTDWVFPICFWLRVKYLQQLSSLLMVLHVWSEQCMYIIQVDLYSSFSAASQQ